MSKKHTEKQMTSAGVKAQKRCRFDETCEQDLIRLVGSKRGKVFYIQNPNWEEVAPLSTKALVGDSKRRMRPSQMVEVLSQLALGKLWGIKDD